MKSNCLTLLSPGEASSVASADELASSLLHFFQEFGIGRDAHYAQRSSVAAFANGVVLANAYPADALTLTEALNLSASSWEAARIASAALVPDVPDDDSWVTNLGRSLSPHWAQLPQAGEPDALRAQIVFSIAVGLEVGRGQVDLKAIVMKRVKMLNIENRFLAGRLTYWSDRQFRPLSSPFQEFVSLYYPDRPVERRVMLQEAGETLACADHLPDPWHVAFWSQQGWSRGRRAAVQHPDVVRALLEESPEGERAFVLRLYRELVLQPAQQNGRVDIERAVLAFIARSDGGRCAVEHCAGDQPRKIARLALDFSLWMGILSALPLPAE